MNQPHRNNFFRITALVIFLLLPFAGWAHNINLAMEKAPPGQVAWFYMKLGFQHILPTGIDHVLFIVALCLLNNRLKTIFWQATAFTLAHSITLALSMKGIIEIPSGIVEPIITLSIVFVALENLLVSELKPWRILIVFFFGLIHGTGFAAALNEIGLPRNQFFTSIAFFNAGVELGQVVVIAIVFLGLIYPFANKHWYKKRIVYPLSLIIALVAAYWTIERML